MSPTGAGVPAGPRDGPGVVVVEHEASCGLGRLAAPLARAFGSVQVLRPYRGDPLPHEVPAGAALVVLGGEMACWEDDLHAWLPATRALLAAAVHGGTPTLGICLGAQLLAVACGGRVDRGAAGLEIGLVPVRPLDTAAADPLVAALRAAGTTAPDADLLVPQYHRDAVTTLPDDAELLITGDRYPVQAFRIGACAWGVQYHPEVTRDGFATWLAHASPIDRGILDDDLLAPFEAGAEALDRLGRAHVTGLAAVSPGTGRLGSGPRLP